MKAARCISGEIFDEDFYTVEFANLTSVARALLNLHEAVTRN